MVADIKVLKTDLKHAHEALDWRDSKISALESEINRLKEVVEKMAAILEQTYILKCSYGGKRIVDFLGLGEKESKMDDELKCVVCGKTTNEMDCGLIGIQINGLGKVDRDRSLVTVCSVECAATYLRTQADNIFDSRKKCPKCDNLMKLHVMVAGGRETAAWVCSDCGTVVDT